MHVFNNRNLIATLTVLSIMTIALVFWLSAGSTDSDDDAEETQLAAVDNVQKIVVRSNSTKFAPLNEVEIRDKVIRNIDENNRKNEERMRIFESEGWEEIEIADAPDPDVMNLNPALLEDREEELQVQIQSNSFTQRDLESLSNIAIMANDEKTRYITIDAMGRIGDDDAKKALIDIYDVIEDKDAQSQILGYITPQSPDDEVSSFLVRKLTEGEFSFEQKKQAFFALAVTEIISDGGVKDRLSGRLSSEFEDVIHILESGMMGPKQEVIW